jgi:hypothetical protein
MNIHKITTGTHKSRNCLFVLLKNYMEGGEVSEFGFRNLQVSEFGFRSLKVLEFSFRNLDVSGFGL